MICSKCGTEIADGMRFCTMCGTPVSAPATGDIETTVMVNQSDGNSAQPQMVQPQMAQGMYNQYNGQPQMAQPQMVQPQMGQGMYNQYNGQPQMVQPQMGQGMYNQYNGQPQMAQPQMGQGMYNQYNGQPQMAPKPPKKPLSPKAKKAIIIGGIVLVLLVVFFLVVWPIITKSKLEGEYVCKDSYLRYRIIFDDGTYVWYDEDGDGTEAGTYVLKDDKVVLTSLSGNETKGTFDADDNVFIIKEYYYTDKYKSTDKDVKLGIDISKTYVDDLENKIMEAAKALSDEDTYDWWYIYEDDWATATGLLKEIGDKIGYSSDKTLQFLLENDFITISIDIYGTDVYVYVDAWY